MGNIQTNKHYINYEDMQHFIKESQNSIIINTLNENEQKCLIIKTIPITEEVRIINNNIKKNLDLNIIIYGKNYSDPTIYNKYKQLKNLYFKNVYIYPGGLFEWLCLQDIFGNELFQTTSNELDILKYRPKSIMYQTKLLENPSF